MEPTEIPNTIQILANEPSIAKLDDVIRLVAAEPTQDHIKHFLSTFFNVLDSREGFPEFTIHHHLFDIVHLLILSHFRKFSIARNGSKVFEFVVPDNYDDVSKDDLHRTLHVLSIAMPVFRKIRIAHHANETIRRVFERAVRIQGMHQLTMLRSIDANDLLVTPYLEGRSFALRSEDVSILLKTSLPKYLSEEFWWPPLLTAAVKAVCSTSSGFTGLAYGISTAMKAVPVDHPVREVIGGMCDLERLEVVYRQNPNMLRSSWQGLLIALIRNPDMRRKMMGMALDLEVLPSRYRE
eukprot:gnl/Dysnectes_brevis/3083_a3830_1050.p1 GENE.gnl/Dysnectes_brevis/3083_a3830_1050~~gnl/Dysnectes_brevis/3083_a3830_1050.p1  ORF type:complete len:295 (+),score=68.00 gnl/Dysnectes_brevis/3083_a3830_1050:95-979(+)